MSEEEKKSVEELEAEYLGELKKKTDRIKSENVDFKAIQVEKDKQEYEDGLKLKWKEDYLKEHPPASKITGIKPIKLGGGEKPNEYAEEFKALVEDSFIPFENFVSEKPFNFTNSDSGCDAIVTAWTPADVYVNTVWHAMYCEANLFKIAVKGISVGKGDGLTVQIRTVGKFAAPTTYGACECMSCVSTSIDTYSVTIAQHGLMTEICELDIWSAGEIYRKEYLWALGKRWAGYFDGLIYNELFTAAAGTSVDMASTFVCTAPALSGSCCSDQSLTNFYNAVNQVVASMREGAAPYDPDYMIISPSVAAVLKRMQTPTVQPWAERLVKIDNNGRLTMFNGIKVIEYCGAQACSTATDTTYAIIIDSRRAVAAAFGQRPKMESERNIDCNSTTYAMWAFFGTTELDVNAIAHIKSPDA